MSRKSGDLMIGTTAADVTGAWIFNYTSTTLADGAHRFTAFAIETTSTASSDFPRHR